MRATRLHTWVLRAVALLLCSSALRAQTPTGGLGGSVVDQHGISMPGVTVVIRGDGLATPVVLTTDGRGDFRAGGLPSGTYTVAFGLAGFSAVTQRQMKVVGGTWSVTEMIRVVLPGSSVDVTTIGLLKGETPIALATSGGDFKVAIADFEKQPVAAPFIDAVRHHVFDGGTIRPLLTAADPTAITARALELLPSGATAAPVYIVEDALTVDAEGKQAIGRIWRWQQTIDTVVAMRQRPRDGPNFATPITITQASIVVPFGVMAPWPAPDRR